MAWEYNLAVSYNNEDKNLQLTNRLTQTWKRSVQTFNYILKALMVI